MSREAWRKRPAWGLADIQPVWLYLDAHTLVKKFGYERLRTFSRCGPAEIGAMAGGGSIMAKSAIAVGQSYNRFWAWRQPSRD
jgi:hypothetical protein